MTTFQIILAVLCVLWICLGIYISIVTDDLDNIYPAYQENDLLDSDVNNKHT